MLSWVLEIDGSFDGTLYWTRDCAQDAAQACLEGEDPVEKIRILPAFIYEEDIEVLIQCI